MNPWHAPRVAHEFRLTRRVEFHETDLAGIVHFANFYRYMESVEHAFLRSLGHSVILRDLDPPLGFPRVHASCDFRRPLRFEDTFELHLLVREVRRRSIAYQIRFRRTDPGPAEEVAVGSLVVACVRKNADGTMEAVPIPPALSGQLKAAPPDELAGEQRPS